MRSVADVVAPPRLGVGFRWLIASSWTSNLGDGLALAAGPLLVASQTDDAFLISMAALVQWLPKLVLALGAGAVSDRLDRRAIVVTVNLARALVLAVVVVAVLTGAVSIALVLAALLLLASAETFADNAAATLLPMLVARRDLPLGNARLMTGVVTLNQLAGPPLGALLFLAGAASPFAAQAVLVVLGALLASRLVLPAHGRAGTSRQRLRHEVAEGLSWVRRSPAVRTLVLTITIFNVTYGAAWSVLVLYALERLDAGSIGFGLLTTAIAAGGVGGTFAYGAITRRVSLGNIMRVGLFIETLTHLGLALTTSLPVALAIMVVFGAHAFVWGTTSTAVRQRAVPSALQGRVGSVNTVGTYGGLVLGAAIGGVLAQHLGVTAPFWFAFAGSAVFLVLIWPQLVHIAHDDRAHDDKGP